MNAFERHNISHLSASSANLFCAAPALWVSKYLLKRDAPVGAAAHRGTAVEAGVTLALKDPHHTMVAECVKAAEKRYRELTVFSGDPKREAEGAVIAPMTREALMKLCEYGEGAVCQERVEYRSPELPIPWLGFSDFHWPNHGIMVDLKTQLKLNSQIKPAHARQVALYLANGKSNYEGRVCYVTASKSAIYKLENPQDHLNALIKIAKTMERFLSVSNDAMELAGLVVPDLESFYWSDPKTRQIAWEVWEI